MTCFAEALLWLFLFLEFCQQKDVLALVMRFCELWMLDAFVSKHSKNKKQMVLFACSPRLGTGGGREEWSFLLPRLGGEERGGSRGEEAAG